MNQDQSMLHVVVHFMAATAPFKDDSANPGETVAQLKVRVLNAFGLTEGGTSDGNTVNYTLYHDKTPLENPNQTLGELAGDKKVLQFKLDRQIVQGL